MANSCMVFITGLWGGNDEYILKTLPAQLAARNVTFVTAPPLSKAEVWVAAENLDAFIKDKIVPQYGQNIHVLGHSMGGLIGRYLVSNIWDEASYKILSLTTLATPHLGTPLSPNESSALLRWVHPAIDDMSYEGVAKFNEPGGEHYSPPHPLVQNYSYCAAISSIWKAGDLLSAYVYWRLGRGLKEAGLDARNDAVVPLFSQYFGKHLGTVPVNHKYFSVKSDFNSPDLISFYEKLIQFLEMERQDLPALHSR